VAFGFIPNRFGLLDASQFSLEKFRDAWMTFSEQLEPLSSQKEWDEFQRHLDGLLSELKTAFNIKSELDAFDTMISWAMSSHNYDALKLMLLFFELQGCHSFTIRPSREFFSKIYAFLDQLSMLHEIQTLVPAINDCLKSMCIFERTPGISSFEESRIVAGKRTGYQGKII